MSACMSVSSFFVRTYCLYWFSNSFGCNSLSYSSVNRFIWASRSSGRFMGSNLFCSTYLRKSSSDIELARCLKPFLMSISLKRDIMFSVWSLEAFKCSMPSKTTTTMISCDMMPAFARKSLLLYWIPFIVAFSMCLDSEYTHMQIANFIRLYFVCLNKESRPCPAGCIPPPSRYGFIEKRLI